jgi:lipopolysaccharide export system ATP-binding protein
MIGLVKPPGNIYLDDLNITDYPMYKTSTAGLGYLAQEALVLEKLVPHNILSVLQLTTLPKEEQVAKMESLIAEFGSIICTQSWRFIIRGVDVEQRLPPFSH